MAQKTELNINRFSLIRRHDRYAAGSYFWPLLKTTDCKALTYLYSYFLSGNENSIVYCNN